MPCCFIMKFSFNIVDVIDHSNAAPGTKMQMVMAYNILLNILQQKVNSESGKQTFLLNIPVDDNLTGFALKKAQYEASEKADEKCKNLAKLIEKVLTQIKQSGFAKELMGDIEEKHAMKVKKIKEELSSIYHNREKPVTSILLYKFTHHNSDFIVW